MKKLCFVMVILLCLASLGACASGDPSLDQDNNAGGSVITDSTIQDILPMPPETYPDDTTHVCDDCTGEPTGGYTGDDYPVEEKPVIYLYPEQPTEIDLRVMLDGALTFTYPDHGVQGWQNFVAYPDGTLIFPDSKEYYCLFWEGVSNAEYDFSEGFCIRGEDTAEFLEWALAEQGLNAREANEFIIYWLPRMQNNAYNLISFQTKAYTDSAVLDINPAPDSLLRVFMAFSPLEESVEIAPQTFEGFERQGFCVVEWGGAEISAVGRDQ